MDNDKHTIHEVKIYPTYYKAIMSGNKTFEIRKNDHNYKIGDYLLLKEWDNDQYTGHQTMRKITYIYKGNGKFGLAEGYCILSIKKV